MRVYNRAPKWFIKRMTGVCNIGLLNTADYSYYAGFGLDIKNHKWDRGVFLTGFEYVSEYWQKRIKEADFIIRFRGKEDV